MTDTYILTLQCPDQPGLVAEVASCITEYTGNILEAHNFNDRDAKRFFMRIEFDLAEASACAKFKDAFTVLADTKGMDWALRDKRQARKVLLLVSKFDHCLSDLLYRNRIGELDMDVVGVISNHPAESIGTTSLKHFPFWHFPITKETKPQQEAQIKQVVEETGAELVVLARYMQILSDDMSSYLEGRCINIHHSFLPGFKGAQPYHQAHARGVKMIGATAHYVTADLDEGPIIHQDVETVSHADTPQDMVRKGRDIERQVLAEAVRLHLEDRVLLDGQKTIVFRS
ncbi:formyltetrahydrofolate deformylase [Parahaliea maris]|uniref:Formyltetrahydrofolate deformylase n=1 Tax=Parahaliea maris TaxID=2716870 RepID=A0A5C8ZWN9_9GAMM|nr:formyltetrahydrofolate deformylase [Parahaliea maris]TXS91887.1 formyltetrahydrofolate deformylase [Parahaliea maris]